jgi:hypothetical protein
LVSPDIDIVVGTAVEGEKAEDEAKDNNSVNDNSKEKEGASLDS